MLHIILLILKIIGWILLVILGLIVLLICVLLFTPLRYRIQASCGGKLSTLDAGIDFSLFFHLASGQVRYQNEQLHWNLRIAWKRLGSGALEEVEEITDTESVEEPEKALADTAVKTTGDPSEEAHPEAGPQMTGSEKEAEQGVPETRKTLPQAVPPEEKSVPPRQSKKKASGFFSKITHIFEKIKYTFCQFCAKIKELLRKKEILMKFIRDEAHQAAFFQGLKELKRLLFRLKPKKFSADVRFGFDDPGYTGYALAGISMLYPLAEGHLNVQPDFEQKILEGSLFIKGHVRARIFAALVWNMILNKNVRILIRDIKNFSFDA